MYVQTDMCPLQNKNFCDIRENRSVCRHSAKTVFITELLKCIQQSHAVCDMGSFCVASETNQFNRQLSTWSA